MLAIEGAELFVAPAAVEPPATDHRSSKAPPDEGFEGAATVELTGFTGPVLAAGMLAI